MVFFERANLEASKYSDLVKVAKENDVYRRYAPKAELVDKLLALNEVQDLNDVSMPSFMENDDSETDLVDQDSESAVPENTANKSESPIQRGRKTRKKITDSVSTSDTVSPRLPLSEKAKGANSRTSAIRAESSVIRKGSPQPRRSSLAGPVRRSLAGPAKKGNTKATHGRRLKRQNAVETMNAENSTEGSPAAPRLTRQRTHDADNLKNMKRQGTFDVEQADTARNGLKRQGTFDVEPSDCDLKSTDDVCSAPSRKLKREGTFEIENIPQAKEEEVSNNCQTGRIRREGTFEVESSSTSKDSFSISECQTPAIVSPQAPKPVSNSISQAARRSLRSPFPSAGRLTVGTPRSSAKVPVSSIRQSATRRFITSRARPIETLPAATRTSASKNKIPSVINEIERKKAEVSAKKAIDISERNKKPDFKKIHERLFAQMENIVDSRQKVIDRANSVQKIQMGQHGPRDGNSKVVRKLLSPKAGKSKIPSPKAGKSKLPSPNAGISKLQSPKAGISKLPTPRTKPIFKHVASAFASHVVAIQKRPSFGNTISGVSKLQSPRLNLPSFVSKTQSPKFSAQQKSTGNVGTTTNRFGFTKAPEISRKEAMKASVLGKKPIKRESPMRKAKQMLHSVRLNKRFELQMKHRFAQQSD